MDIVITISNASSVFSVTLLLLGLNVGREAGFLDEDLISDESTVGRSSEHEKSELFTCIIIL